MRKMTDFINSLTEDQRKVLALQFTVDTVARQSTCGRATIVVDDLRRVAHAFDAMVGRETIGAKPEDYMRNSERRPVIPTPDIRAMEAIEAELAQHMASEKAIASEQVAA